MGLLPVILGAGLLIMLSGDKKSSSKKSEEKDDGVVDASGLLTKPKPDRKGRPKCEPNEYYSPETDKCEKFWIDGETDALVLEAIQDEVEKLSGNWKTDGEKWSFLCEDLKQGEFGDPQPNPNVNVILKNVIYELWEGAIPKDQLPPTVKSPDWVKELWKRVGTIYYWETCGIKKSTWA